jgi:hypothetical protein
MILWISFVFDVISPFLLLISLNRVFSFLILVRFAKGLQILFIFSKKKLFVSFILCMVFCLYFTDFRPCYYFSLSACFGLMVFMVYDLLSLSLIL